MVLPREQETLFKQQWIRSEINEFRLISSVLRTLVKRHQVKLLFFHVGISADAVRDNSNKCFNDATGYLIHSFTLHLQNIRVIVLHEEMQMKVMML